MEKPVVLLLAGGKSTRFWPLQEKNTYSFLGKNLVQRQIEALESVGFQNIIIVASEEVFDYLVDHSTDYSHININFIRQKENLSGMSGAILSAVENYEAHYQGKPLYIVNCNDLFDVKLHENILHKFETRPESDVFISCCRMKEYQPLGYLDFDDGRLIGIKEKPGKDNCPSDLANIVAHLYRHPDQLFKSLKGKSSHSVSDDAYEQSMDYLIKKGKAEAVVYEGMWKILKYPWHILDVMEYFLLSIEQTQIDPSAVISDKATIGKNVIIGPEVKVYEGAVIQGPCYIGKGTVIGNNSLVRGSMIGENCVIGFASEVARSYLGNSIWLHSNYIGDSILERNVSFGSGAVTANLRLDEQNLQLSIKGQKIDTGRNKLGLICGRDVRVGINASLMPGIKIGSQALIGPGVVLSQDVLDGSFCRQKQTLSITENIATVNNRQLFSKGDSK